MKYAIYRAVDAAIVSIVDSTANLEMLASWKVGGVVQITDAQYDAVRRLFNRHGEPLFRVVEGGVSARPPAAKWWAVVATDGTVHGGHFSRIGNEPQHPPHVRLIEIDEATFQQIDGPNQFLPDSALPRWSVDENDNIVENTDDRLVLEVAMSDTAVDEGEPVSIQLTIKNAAGDTVAFNGRRELTVQHGDTLREVRVGFSDGVAQIVDRVLPAGLWSIVSTDPDKYRVTGQTAVRVAESW